MPATDDEPFGSQVYQELRRQSGFDVMTQVWDYAAIQKLKQANRDEVLKLLSNVGCPLVSDSPLDAATVAEVLSNEVRRRGELTTNIRHGGHRSRWIPPTSGTIADFLLRSCF